jgi:hypothetical protein
VDARRRAVVGFGPIREHQGEAMARTPDLAGALGAVVARTVKATLGSKLRRLEGQIRRLEKRLKIIECMTARASGRPARPAGRPPGR